jgi:predicted RNA binding protein YcfA (HicA-like mRNA interferase family)
MDKEEFRERIAQHPKAVRFQEMKKLLELYGFIEGPSQGSHFTYRHPDGRKITVPFRRPHVKPAYVRAALQLTEED